MLTYAGSEDSLDMVHSCSQIGMYLALIMLALGTQCYLLYYYNSTNTDADYARSSVYLLY
jgi:hypothetical protein